MSKKVLRIISSPRGEASVSRKLGSEIVSKIKTRYPGSIVTEWDLVKMTFPHLQEEQINLFFTPTESLTSEQAKVLENSNDAIAELQNTDIVVIDAPMYNFTVTSYLKAYLDHIVRYGITFATTPNGVEGLIKNKKVYVAISSGFIYTEGAFQSFDLLTPYLKAMLGWLGMTDVTFFRAEGVNMPAFQDEALQKAIDSVTIE